MILWVYFGDDLNVCILRLFEGIFSLGMGITQSAFFIPTLDAMTKFVIITI